MHAYRGLRSIKAIKITTYQYHEGTSCETPLLNREMHNLTQTMLAHEERLSYRPSRAAYSIQSISHHCEAAIKNANREAEPKMLLHVG